MFGASIPSGLEEGSVPYEQRRKMFEGYLNSKANEKPTGYGRAGVTGGIAGGLGGALLGGMLGGSGASAGAGAGVGGLTGALLGLAMAYADRGDISEAKEVLRMGRVDDRLAEHIIAEHQERRDGQYVTDEMRHQEMMDALRNNQR